MSKERLTYRNSIEGEAYLKYGLAAKWEKMPRYDILDSAIQKLAEYEELEEQGLLLRLPCHCKDCVHWSDMAACTTEHAKVCTVGRYMVGENGYCVYAKRKE